MLRLCEGQQMKKLVAAREYSENSTHGVEAMGQPGPIERDGSEVRYSIVITCYNQQEFIRDAVESVLSQGHASKEVIVVDDGSQDGSLEALKRYGASIRVISLSTNCGAIEARNRGAAAARGEYLVFLDGDDLFTPWALDVYGQLIMERHPITIVSGARWFSGSVPVLRRDDAPRRVEFVEYKSLMARDRKHGWLTGAFVVCRQAFDDVGGWSAGIFHLDIMDLAAKLGYSGDSILVRSPYTMLYRMHATNSVRSIPPFLRAAHLLISKERAGQYPGGPEKQFERYAFQGGMIAYWARRALGEGIYGPSVRLVARGWSMVLAAVIRKLIVRLRGRCPVEILQLKLLRPDGDLGGESHA
jgi:glycosyltransferase involved in cell wall biosynthesis